MKKAIPHGLKREPAKENRGKSNFDWWLLSFIAIVIILLVVLLSYP